MKYKLGILGASKIAFNKFLPALSKINNLDYYGISSRSKLRAEKFQKIFGGNIYKKYDDIINDPMIDIVYIPLPPALHYKWALKALKNNKHIIIEKPFTINLRDTQKLLKFAAKKNLAVHENYMFEFHSQINHVNKQINKKKLDKLNLVDIKFGFPFRGNKDFRYSKKLGGGALFDCGGYTIKLATILLGRNISIISADLNVSKKFDIDISGNVVIKNDKGIVANLTFSMDSSYRCSLDVWGSKSSIFYDRIFTPPNDLKPKVILDNKSLFIDSDDQFVNSIKYFFNSIKYEKQRKKCYNDILIQASLLNDILNFK